VAEFRCSALSAALDEPVLGTASLVRSWLLVEQPGSWGRDALLESRLPLTVARELVARAERHHVRVLLIRRPDRTRITAARRCFAIHSARPEPWIEERPFHDPDELLDVDFAALARGGRFGFGADRSEPLYLVCTNGRHDPCCAQFGRPVIRALASDRVWESSHLGGERFAGNLVCFPDGLYFGRVDAATAAQVAGAYERGVVDLAHYRGRAGDAFVVQAAEFFLRRHEDLTGVDDVAPVRRTRLDSGLAAVEFAARDGRRFEVHVAVQRAPDPRPLTCTASSAQRPPTFTLVDLFPLDASGSAVH
jgi:hypothetical protein